MLFSTNSAIAFNGFPCESAMIRIAFQSSPILSLPRSAALPCRGAFGFDRRAELSPGSGGPDHLLVDAVRVNCDCPQTKIIHGDALSISIAAASIIAKVHPDQM